LEKFNFGFKRLSILLVMIVFIVAMEGCIFGNSTQYIEIQTWYDLEAIRNDPSGDYILMNDLDSATDGYDELAGPTANDGKGWHPLNGPGLEETNPPFTGTLDGQGYEIRDLFIDLPNTKYIGFFSIVGEGGHIENIGIVNTNVTSGAYIGALVGVNRGSVSYSYSTGSLSGVSWVGGLVGQNEGTVSYSYASCDVSSDSGTGGLMGANAGTVSNSYATGNVAGDSGAGGLMAANSGTVSNSYSTSKVSGNEYLGGLVGYSDQGTVSGSFWDIETTGQSISAGGTGKTATEMQLIATFQGAEWNIIAVENASTRNIAYIWNIVNEQTYPFLSRES
jgi:hypothetical protein